MIDATTASLVHAKDLVVLTTFGRMMQTSSDSALLTIVLELGSIVAEVFEARDLLRLDTPFMRGRKTASWFVSSVCSSRRVVAEDGVSSEVGGNGVIEDEEADDNLPLRQRFCSDVLITTQLAEVSQSLL